MTGECLIFLLFLLEYYALQQILVYVCMYLYFMLAFNIITIYKLLIKLCYYSMENIYANSTFQLKIFSHIYIALCVFMVCICVFVNFSLYF